METTESVVVFPQIAIIESPRVTDVSAGLVEKDALSAALKLMRVKHKYYRVANVTEMDRSLAYIAIDAKVTPGRTAYFPQLFLHYSMHGNANGIRLTDGDFMPWRQLGDKLLNLAHTSGRIFPEVNASILTVCFSTCYGLYGARMAAGRPRSPYYGLIGANHKPNWRDSLTAFIAFYNCVCQPESEILEGVKRMNASIGKMNLFECRVAPQVDARTNENP